MRIALGQINTTVGDLRGNVDRMIADGARSRCTWRRSRCFPELSINGYPPRDLVEKASFLERGRSVNWTATRGNRRPRSVLVCGYVGRADGGTGKKATNSAAAD